MSNLIVIRLVPQGPIAAGDFTNYLTALGGLQITAFDLSFNSPTAGQNVGTATVIAPTTLPFPLGPVTDPPSGFAITPPKYPSGITNGIVQQYDVEPPQFMGLTVLSAYYQLESVATAVIEIPSPAAGQTVFENLKLEMSWGSGSGEAPIPVSVEYYNVALSPGPTPDPAANQWASLTPSLYLSLPARPTSAGATQLNLPTDGTAPPSIRS